MQIQLTAGSTVLTATLADTDPARALAAQLPLELTVEDFHGKEKIAYLPDPLTIEGTPGGLNPVAGDLAYFVPWGNLALYYRDGTQSSDLMPLGRLDADPAALEALTDGTSVRITVV